MMGTPVARALAAFLVLLVAAGGSAGAVESQGGLGIRLVEAPVATKDDPRARTYIVDVARPGTTFTRRIEIRNDTARAEALDLYPSAADISKGSWTVQDGRAPNELTGWITVQPATLRLAAGARATAEVTVTVPPTASNGERYAAVLASTRAQPAPGQTVALVNRVGIRVYLAVSDSDVPPTDFTVDSLAPGRSADGKPFVRAQVKNTGGRALDLSGTMTLREGPGGLSAGPFPARLGTTLGPGQAEPVTVDLDEALPAGPWRARLELSSGLTKRTVEGTITFPDKGEAAPVDADLVEDDSPPWPLIAAAVGGLLLLGLLLLFFLKRRNRKDDRDHTAVTVSPPA